MNNPFQYFEYLLTTILESAGISMPALVVVGQQIAVVLITIAIPFCLMTLIGIVYSVERLKAIRKKESELLNSRPEADHTEAPMSPEDKKVTDKWSKILTYAESANTNDWMLAIIEADIILGEMLDKMGYQGDSIGEKLKRVEKSDFLTLDQAWEAHKVRNAIAHQGSDFVLNQREVQRVIGLYREVFEEFYYIQ